MYVKKPLLNKKLSYRRGSTLRQLKSHELPHRSQLDDKSHLKRLAVGEGP